MGGKIPGGQGGKITLEINEDGMIVSATEDGKKLEYHANETKKMSDGDDAIFSTNPCRWVKINGKWVCV